MRPDDNSYRKSLKIITFRLYFDLAANTRYTYYTHDDDGFQLRNVKNENDRETEREKERKREKKQLIIHLLHGRGRTRGVCLGIRRLNNLHYFKSTPPRPDKGSDFHFRQMYSIHNNSNNNAFARCPYGNSEGEEIIIMYVRTYVL